MTHNSSKYPAELIKNIAEEIDCGFVCFLNTDTLETESIPGESYPSLGEDDRNPVYQEIFDKVDTWENWIRINPPESWESFRFMEDFIDSCIPDGDTVKSRLSEAISRRKPFQNFKSVIDSSRHRQLWFDYKQSRLEEFVREQLHTGYHEFDSDNDE